MHFWIRRVGVSGAYCQQKWDTPFTNQNQIHQPFSKTKISGGVDALKALKGKPKKSEWLEEMKKRSNH